MVRAGQELEVVPEEVPDGGRRAGAAANRGVNDYKRERERLTIS